MKIQKINSTIFNIMLFMGAFSILSIISCSQKNEKDYILECAIEVSKKIEDNSQEGAILACVAQLFTEIGNYEKAIDIAENIEYAFMKASAFSMISTTLAENGYMERALEIVKRIDEGSFKDNALSEISVVFARNRQYENALLLSDSISDGFLQTWTLKEVAVEYFKAEKMGDASKIMEKALDIVKSIEDPAKKNNSMGAISCGYVKIGEHEMALNIVDLMDNEGKRARTLKNVAGVYIDLGDSTQALGILAKAYDIAKKLEDSPDVDEQLLLAGIGAKFFKAGDYEKGTKIIRSLDKDILKMRNLSWLSFRYKELGKVEEASDLVKKALEIAEKMKDEYYKALAFSGLAGNYTEEGEHQKAFELLLKALDISGNIEERRLKVMALANIASAFNDIGKYEKAFEICKELEDSPLNQAWILVGLANSYSESNQEKDRNIRKILDEIVKDWE